MKIILVLFLLFLISCAPQPLVLTKSGEKPAPYHLIAVRDTSIVIAPFTASRHPDTLVKYSRVVYRHEINSMMIPGQPKTGPALLGVVIGGGMGALIGCALEPRSTYLYPKNPNIIDASVTVANTIIKSVIGAVAGATLGLVIGIGVAGRDVNYDLYSYESIRDLTKRAIYPTNEPDEFQAIR